MIYISYNVALSSAKSVTKKEGDIDMSKLIKILWTVISYAPLMLVCGIAIFIDSLTTNISRFIFYKTSLIEQTKKRAVWGNPR